MSASLITTYTVNGKKIMTMESLPIVTRKTWDFKPITRIVPSGKQYRRKTKFRKDLTGE